MDEHQSLRERIRVRASLRDWAESFTGLEINDWSALGQAQLSDGDELLLQFPDNGYGVILGQSFGYPLTLWHATVEEDASQITLTGCLDNLEDIGGPIEEEVGIPVDCRQDDGSVWTHGLQ